MTATVRHLPTAKIESKSAKVTSLIVIMGDDVNDIHDAQKSLIANGYTCALIDIPWGLDERSLESAQDADVVMIDAGLDLEQMNRLLQTVRGAGIQSRVRAIIQTRHQTAADRRQLIKSGGRHLLSMPTKDKTLLKVLRGALIDLATAETIQDYLTTHKSAVGRMMTGVFEIRTMAEAEKLSTMLATNYPSPERVASGIWELLSNGVEHGNLEIDFEHKAELLERGEFEAEIRRRLSTLPYSERRVRVSFEATENLIRLGVVDQGNGFDYNKVLEGELPTDKPNGRGICVARQISFDSVTYYGRGNEVEAIVRL